MNGKDFVKEMRILYKNKYSCGKLEFLGENVKIRVVCPKHGEFLETPKNLLNGIACKQCEKEEKERVFRNKIVVVDKRFTTANFIERAMMVHNGKYDYNIHIM